MNDLGANVRAAAAWVVDQVFRGQSLKVVIAKARTEFTDVRDRALLEAMSVHVIRQRRSLEYVLSRLMNKPLPVSESGIHCLLLVGLAQLHIMKLQEHAAVSATVNAARLLGKSNHVGLINAILRRSLREPIPASTNSAVALNHPDWLVAQIQNDWPEDWQEILRANNQQAPLCLRVNSAKISRDDYLSLLHAQNLSAEVCAQNPHALILNQTLAPTQLPGWSDGLLAVQDVSAQLVVHALPIKDGMRILDMCAAPGGKTAQLAVLPNAHLVAMDVSENRLEKVADLLQRLQIQSEQVQLQVGDATQALPAHLPTQFDAILLDAPCSATGIIRRQPDVKWHRTPKDIGALNTLQWRLLKNAWQVLKPGGYLLYSTCSVLKAENATLLEQFMLKNVDARAMTLSERFGRISGAGRQRFPGEYSGDGFFYAMLQKSAHAE